jgi:hypothetical protein
MIVTPGEGAGWPAIAEAMAVVAATFLAGVSIWKQSRNERAHRKAVEARIGATAYAVRRQVRSWLEEAPDEVGAVIAVVETWDRAARQLGGKDEGEVPGVTHGMLEVGRSWATARTGVQFDRAEARMLELVALAPEASTPLATEVWRALVIFYDGTERLNRLSALIGPNDQSATRELARAYRELERCVQHLDTAVQRGGGRDLSSPAIVS